MSSLARRTLRTTAAAAGMTALGVGLAGNALAAADVPGPPPPPEPTTTLPGVPGLPVQNPLATIPGEAGGPSLPMLFVFQGPTVHSPTINTAGPSSPGAVRLPASAPVRTTQATSAASTAAPAQVGPTEAGPVRAESVSPRSDQVGAPSESDSAGLFDGLVGHSIDQQGLGTAGFGLDGLG
jgi:hypothetical protein